jgi:hypothetical protein
MIKDKSFNGVKNFDVDNIIENNLQNFYIENNISQLEATANFPIYIRRTLLKRFLAHYQLFLKTIELPGDIIELGIFRGSSLMSWANFLEIHNMGDRQKQVFGFDNFEGFKVFDQKDGKFDERVEKNIGGFDPGKYYKELNEAIKIFDLDRFIPYKPRVKLIKGEIENEIPEFIKNNPGLRVSLIHFDCDLYLPTKIALENLWPLVVKGGILIFDEYSIRPWEGESKAVDEFFQNKKVKFCKFNWCPNPGAYIIKE